MECAKIKELLSDYMDGLSDPDTKKGVEEHLSTCERCGKELNALKALVDELHSLNGVKAPEDFLDQVHKRLDQSSLFQKVIRSLFVPIRIKVPLEVAAVGVMAVLVFSVLLVQQREIQAPKTPAKYTLAEKSTTSTPKLPLKKKVRKSEAAFKQAIPQPGSTNREPIELALILKQEMPAKGRSPAISLETVPRTGTSIAKRSLGRPAGPDTRIEPGQITEEERAAEISGTLRTTKKDEMDLPTLHTDQALSRIRRLIELSEGRVHSVQYDRQTHRPESVHAEIPLRNFNSFAEHLRQIGELQKPPNILSGKTDQIVQVRIKLLLPK